MIWVITGVVILIGILVLISLGNLYTQSQNIIDGLNLFLVEIRTIRDKLSEIESFDFSYSRDNIRDINEHIQGINYEIENMKLIKTIEELKEDVSSVELSLQLIKSNTDRIE